MKMQSSTAKEIKAYIASHDKEQNMAVRVQLEGEVQTLPVYRVPITLLRYNIRNGRFASELRQKEAEVKRKLDNTNPKVAKIIQSLLLEQSPTETAILRKDLTLHGQIEPGIITHDGSVINANRRLSVISLLHSETHDARWEYLKVAVLPDNVSEKDLWRIEAGLQFGKDFRLEYGPINELLKLREGIACGLAAPDIAATLLGRFTVKDVEERLRRLDLIDGYLDQIGKPGDYAIIGQERSMEKFNSLSSNVINQLRVKAELSAPDLYKITQVGFALIKDQNASHWDIRKLTSIARSPKARAKLLEPLPEEPFEATKDVLADAFENAKDVVAAEDEQQKPERLLQRALTAVQSIDPKNPKVALPTTQAALGSLIEACKSLEVKS